MITYGSNLMTLANANLFAADHSDVEIEEISLELDLYEVVVVDIKGIGEDTYDDLIVFEAPLPLLELPVEEETTEEE